MISFPCTALIVVSSLVAVPFAHADMRPAVKISMPPDSPIAQAGQLFTGEFQVRLAEPGLLESVQIDAPGWRFIDMDTSALSHAKANSTVAIPFQMIVGDPDQLLTLRFTFASRPVSKSLFVGPMAAQRKTRDRSVVQVAPGAPDRPRVIAGDAITLHLTGRLIYDRPIEIDDNGDPVGNGTIPVGVDRMWVEIIDEDDLSTETVWEGYTDRNGYFDTGEFQWDDCDALGCDDPDLYIRWECDNDVVNVQDANDIFEADWSWSTESDTLDDFTGSFHDFGTLKPSDSGQMPILHIHNSITRAHRWIRDKSGTGIDLDHVDVQWPEPEGGPGAFYNWFFEEIYIAPSRQWMEATHTHEYGHHFINNEANYEESDYCNGICDFDDCGHCMWCEENPKDAWSEGWPNWLADIVTRDYPDSYTFSDGTAYEALRRRSQETVRECTEHGIDDFGDPLITEGFLGALLRDIEDDDPDPVPSTLSDFEVTVRQDCLSLGPEEIFEITIVDEPTTTLEFMLYFLAKYPELMPRFFGTALNISRDFADVFPPDLEPPGVVESVWSSSHPAGTVNPSPCMVLSWDTPPDDVKGALAYSIVLGTDSAGEEPDESDVDVSGSCVDVKMEARGVGAHYLSIKARGWDKDWSNDWGVFGPFNVADCNSNGIVDVCEVSCDPSSAYTGENALDCNIGGAFCFAQKDCGFAEDCNSNKVPDGCDLASGESDDCNENSIPDECENLSRWAGGSDSWSAPLGWINSAIPQNGDHVCIQDDNEPATVSYTTGTTSVAILACDESLRVARLFPLPAAELILSEPSWVRGNLTLMNEQSILRVDNRLDIDGVFAWIGSNGNSSAKLTGSGTTYARGDMHLTGGGVHLDDHDLVLESNTAIESLHHIRYVGPSTVTIRPQAVWDHRSDADIILGGGTTSLFRNEGTFIKSDSTGSSDIASAVQNAGLMHVQAGTLRIANFTSDNTGDFLADPGTFLDFVGGGHEFAPSSSIVGERIRFTTGRVGTTNIRGTYDVSVATTVSQLNVVFASGANVINYAPDFLITGRATFNAVAGKPILFNSLTGGSADFNTGDPIVAETLTINNGGEFAGVSPLTVNGLLTWNAGGDFLGPGPLNSNGQLVISVGTAQKNLIDRVLNNAGTAAMNGPINMLGSSVVNNLAGAVWDIAVDGVVVVNGSATPFNNAGTLLKSAGAGASSIQVPFNNSGTVEVRVGTLEFRYPYIQTAGETLLNGGNIGTFGSPLPAAPRMDGGRLRGSGVVGNGFNNVGGVVEPGLSAGQITVNGNYTQEAGGTLRIEIGGHTPITEFDQLMVTGNASLNGTLDVRFIDGFAPAVGDSFIIVTAASRVGIFDDYQYEGLPSHIEASVTTSPSSLALLMLQRDPPSGDCNGSETVGAEDYDIFQTCLSGPSSTSPTPPIATACRCVDMDLDDEVDLHDMAQFMNQFQAVP